MRVVAAPAMLADIGEAQHVKAHSRQGGSRARISGQVYVGTFEHTSRFEAHLDPLGLTLILERPGAEDMRKSAHMDVSFGLFAGILRELASSIDRIPKDDIAHRAQPAEAVAELHRALY